MADVVEISGTLKEILNGQILPSFDRENGRWYLEIEEIQNGQTYCRIILQRVRDFIKQRVNGKISLKNGSKHIFTRSFNITYTACCAFQYLPMNVALSLLSKQKSKQFSLSISFNVTDKEQLKCLNQIPQLQSQTASASESTESLYCEDDSTIDSEGLSMLQKLSEDMTKLFKDESRCDISFKCGSDVVKSHKIILCARSPVFEAMFRNSFQESRSGIVVIKDVSSDAFRCLLKYLYNGVIPDLSVSLAGEILNAAEKYQVLELKSACIEFLESSVTNETVLPILQIAFLHDDNLKNFAMNHISKNIRHIKRLPVWSKMEKENPSLIFEVMDFVINDIVA